MFNNIFRAKSPDNLLIEEYKKYRNSAKKLSEVILSKYTDNQSLETITRLMGVRHGKSIIMDSDEELNFLMDFSLYEYRVDGKNFLERYQESNSELDQNEAKIIAAQLLAYTSLFKIIDTNPSNATLLLSDLLNNGQEITMMDINLSATAINGSLLFTRLVPFKDIYMYSGMFCAFHQSYERALLKEYKSKMKKVKSDIESQQRFIAFYKLSKTKGIETMTTSY
jgi:hypothetical protein